MRKPLVPVMEQAMEDGALKKLARFPDGKGWNHPVNQAGGARRVPPFAMQENAASGAKFFVNCCKNEYGEKGQPCC